MELINQISRNKNLKNIFNNKKIKYRKIVIKQDFKNLLQTQILKSAKN